MSDRGRDRAIAEMLAEFHTAISDGDTDRVWLRDTLHQEEADELSEALLDWDDRNSEQALMAVARELADVVYVAFGTAHGLDIDLYEAVRAVHKSNMSKLVDGKVVKREDGKVLKGPGFVPPDMTAAVRRVEPECTCAFGPDEVDFDPACYYHGENGTMVATFERRKAAAAPVASEELCHGHLPGRKNAAVFLMSSEDRITPLAYFVSEKAYEEFKTRRRDDQL